LDPNKRCAPPLPRSGGLQWWWRWSCSNKALKVVNSIINDCDTHFIKLLIFFTCSHFKPYQWVLSKVDHISLKINRLEQVPWSPSLENHQNLLKTKFIAKPSLKNQNRYKAHNYEMYSRTLLFWSKD
jgi:hypothetical protein